MVGGVSFAQLWAGLAGKCSQRGVWVKFPFEEKSSGDVGLRTSSRTGCQQRGCTATALTRTLPPQEDAGLPCMENPHRRARQTLTAKTVKDLICLLFVFHLTFGFYLDAPSQFADVSPNSALDCCIDDDVQGLGDGDVRKFRRRGA